MIKKIILLVAIFTLPFVAISQERGDFRLGAYTQTTVYQNNLLPHYGICAELFVADNFSLNYKYSLGLNSNGEITGHINPAIFLLSLTGGYYEAVLAVLLISEGVSYHFELNDNIELSPYINPFGAEINFYEDDAIVLSGATGINLQFKHFTPIEELILTFNAGATVIYKDFSPLPTVGVSLMYNF